MSRLINKKCIYYHCLIRSSGTFNSVVAIHELPLHGRFEIPVHQDTSASFEKQFIRACTELDSVIKFVP